jgi:hypothetical protein
MHQALLVPEVLLEIFAHVNDTESCSTLISSQKHLAALAETCKTFYEPAMEFLWAEINELEPLLGCVTRLHPLVYRSGIEVSARLCSFLFGLLNVYHMIVGPALGERLRAIICPRDPTILTSLCPYSHIEHRARLSFPPSLNHPRVMRITEAEVVNSFHQIFGLISASHAAPMSSIDC